MSNISPKGEASSEDEIDLLTALNTLSISGNGQAIRKSGFLAFENVNVGSSSFRGVNTNQITVSATEPTSPELNDLWIDIS